MISPASGVLLIADPFLKDPNFLRSVVFLCEHKEEGSIGFVLNKLLHNTIDELIPELEGFEFPVYLGGPVQTDSLHFLHQYPNEIPGGQKVMDGVYWGGDFDILIQHIKSNTVNPNKIKFFIGYSGWEADQLNAEIDEKTWLTVKATRKLLFLKKVSDTWKDSLKHLGGDFKILINYPIDPQLN